MTLNPAFVGSPVRVGGKWLYSLVLVEAARRPFNRTQLESLSRPAEEIDTRDSQEVIRISNIRSSRAFYSCRLFMLKKEKKRITRRVLCARLIELDRLLLSQLRRVKKKFLWRMISDGNRRIRNRPCLSSARNAYADNGDAAERVSMIRNYIEGIKQRDTGARTTRLTEMQIRSRRIKPTVLQAPVALDARREGVNHECTKRVFKRD